MGADHDEAMPSEPEARRRQPGHGRRISPRTGGIRWPHSGVSACTFAVFTPQMRGCEFAILGATVGGVALSAQGIAMKPAPFDYQAPGTLREAIDLLASNPEACVIAGGQSLMPVLAFRLATPSLLVDLRRLPGLGNIDLRDDGFRLGALVRWRDIEDDQRLASAHPLLRAAIAHVAHYQIRNRGTVGGGLARADPAGGT